MDKDDEKDLYIKSNLKAEKYIPEKIDNLFNNSINLAEDKSENENVENNQKPNKNKKQIIIKRVAAIAACVVVALGGGNIYATTQGYDNVFFMIKEWIDPETSINGKDEILSDRDITISYEAIEIAKGIKMQINRLVVKDSEAKLYLKVDQSETDLKVTPFTYIVKDEEGKEICNYKSTKAEEIYTEELKLEGLNKDTTKLELEVKQDDKTTLVKFNIDLENKEIQVIGNEYEIQKISEEELKKYLSAFALLNYEDNELNSSVTDEEILENVRKLMVARQIAEIEEINILTGEKYNHMSYSTNSTVIDPETMNAIMDSFTNIELDEDGLVKCDIYYKKDKVKNEFRYINTPNTDFQGNVEGLCIDVKSIMYSNGIYTVTFTYCYPTSQDEVNNRVEDLPVYEMTLGLTMNEDQTYSKYRISSISESKLVKEGKNDIEDEDAQNEDNQEIVEEDNNEKNTIELDNIKESLIGIWWRTYNVDHEEISELSIQFKNDETFIELTMQEANENGVSASKKTGEGTYKIIQDEAWDIVELTYNNGEIHELLYGQKGTAKDNNTKLHYSAGKQVFTKFTVAQ